jgi:hypothetical protein
MSAQGRFDTIIVPRMSPAAAALARIIHERPADTVILSAAKNLERLGGIEILRCAQDDAHESIGVRILTIPPQCADVAIGAMRKHYSLPRSAGNAPYKAVGRSVRSVTRPVGSVFVVG